MEEELRSGEVVDCDTGTARRGSTSARRSFFRRKKNQRSSSRDSTEIASFSNTQLSFFPDSGILNDDGGVMSYQRVELLDCMLYTICLEFHIILTCLYHLFCSSHSSPSADYWTFVGVPDGSFENRFSHSV